MAEVAYRLIGRLTELGQSMAVAESLTGGLVCGALTAVPGSSAVVRGAIVAYATASKHEVLGVPRAVLDAHGAVHPDTAAAMAEAVRARFGSDWGLATTGVAGPDPQEGHPVGTVHIALAGEEGTLVETLHTHGDRAQIRSHAVAAVLELADRTIY